MSRARKSVQFRRKREGRTNYNRRLKILLSRKPRIVIRSSLKNMTAQIISYEPKGDKVLAGVHSSSLKKYGWPASRGNIPSAYLTGYLLGKLAASKGIGEAVVDTGLIKPVSGGRLYACVKGAIDAGMSIPVQEDVLPKKERIIGTHIADHSKNSKSGFSEYSRNNVNPADINRLFEKVKSTIESKPAEGKK